MHNGGTCIHEDDMKAILEEILASDLLILSFPLYCYGMPAPLKAIIDRILPLSSMAMEKVGDRYEHVGQADFSHLRYLIIVDTYGGSAPHGGGAFSGKDPTKVDRSAAYAARYVAKNIVAAGLAERCQVQLAYAIGVAKPVSILIDTCGTGTVSDDALREAVEKVFDLRPSAIIRDLDLKKPIYRPLAAYGHMGREDLGVAWEKTDRTQQLLDALAQ